MDGWMYFLYWTSSYKNHEIDGVHFISDSAQKVPNLNKYAAFQYFRICNDQVNSIPIFNKAFAIEKKLIWQFCPVTVTKIWTPYCQTNFFYQYTNKLLTFKALYPCITLGVQTNRKLAKKMVEIKKSSQYGTFCLPSFLTTQVWVVVTAKFSIGSYFSKLPNVSPWY